MILNFKTKKQQTDASARVVDGKLILSLPDALTPVVWQMDLDKAKASALEVVADEAMNGFKLSLKTPKGETIDVAAFDERSDAVEGLLAASSALENAHGQIRPGAAQQQSTNNAGEAPKPTKPKASTGKKIMGALLALVVAFILFTIWSTVIPKTIRTGGAVNTANTASSAINPQSSSGVPVSADDFLRAQ